MSQADAAAKIYREEAYEVLATLEESLLELETDPKNMDCVAKVFRCLHTIKGSGSMFGFEEIARFTHDLETVYDLVRNGELAVDTQLLTLTLTAKDHIHRLLETDPLGTEQTVRTSNEILAGFEKYLARDRQAEAGADEQAPRDAAAEPAGEPETFWIRYRPDPGTFLSGTKPLGLLRELSELGTMQEVFRHRDIPSLEEMDPEKVYGWWDMILVSDRGEDAVRDVFIFVEDDHGLVIRKIFGGGIRAEDIDQLLSACLDTPNDDPDALTAMLTGMLEEKVEMRKRPQGGAQAGKAAQTAHSSAGQSSIRVDSGKLDKLVNEVGELVIIHSRFAQAVKDADSPVLQQVTEDLERLTAEMRDVALSIRMLPFGTMFSVFRRLVRDLSSALGRDVRLVTEGAETELDKTVIDRLKDPLMHILRNSLDHGIEPPEIRKQKDKPPAGTITLSARHSSGDVIITVSDDGAGIDPQKVRQKAVQRGLVKQDEALSDTEVLQFVFEPGFSTADKISDVSGRGVGLDVVKKSIDSLRGSVEIESEKNTGTTFKIRLPLTLAIIDGLNVLIGGESFIIPLDVIVACQERFHNNGEVKEFEVIEWMGKMIPCLSLRKILNVPGGQPKYERVIIARADDLDIGLAVDVVMGRQQAVIKSLGRAYRNHDWISGTTINGDGGISLILDVQQFVRFAGGKKTAAA